MSMKDLFLKGFKPQWKTMLMLKFADNLDALKTVDMKALSQEMFGHSAVKGACEMVGVTAEEIETLLCECRNELLSESARET